MKAGLRGLRPLHWRPQLESRGQPGPRALLPWKALPSPEGHRGPEPRGPWAGGHGGSCSPWRPQPRRPPPPEKPQRPGAGGVSSRLPESFVGYRPRAHRSAKSSGTSPRELVLSRHQPGPATGASQRHKFPSGCLRATEASDRLGGAGRANGPSGPAAAWTECAPQPSAKDPETPRDLARFTPSRATARAAHVLVPGGRAVLAIPAGPAGPAVPAAGHGHRHCLHL